MATYMVGSSDLPRPSYSCAGGTCGANGNYQFADPIVHLNYGIVIPLANKLTLSYAHSYINQNLGRVTTITNAYTYQVLNDDRVDDVGLNYTSGQVALSGGWHQRVRMCCGNSAPGDAANQTAYHYLYFQGGIREGASSKYFGKMFGLTLQEAFVPHNTTPYFTSPNCANGAASCPIASEGDKWKFTYTPNVTIPIGNPKTSTFAVFGTYLNNWDYFLNAPIMYLYNEADYGFIVKFPPVFTLTVNNSNLYQYHQSNPFYYPNTINRNKLIVVLDAALPIM